MADCAIHPGVTATFTCRRCGAFACAQCRAAAFLCKTCDQRTAGMTAGGVDFAALISDSFRLTGVNLGRAAAFATVIVAVELVRDLITTKLIDATDASQLIVFGVVMILPSVAASSISESAWIQLIASGARGEPLSVPDALKKGLERAFPLFLCNLAFGLAVALGLMVCIIPGLILALRWCLAGPAVVVGGFSPLDALGRSTTLGDRDRTAIGLALLVTGLASAGAGAVVELASKGGIEALSGALSPELVGHIGFLFEAPGSLLGTLVSLPVVTVPVLAYLRLERIERLADP